MWKYEVFGGRLRQFGTREIILFVLVIVLVVVVIGLAAGLGHASSQLPNGGESNQIQPTPPGLLQNQTTAEPPPEAQKTCYSRECLETAAYMLSNMNTSADPCEDFYQYACGNWPLRNPLPPNYIYYNLVSKMNARVDQELESVLGKWLRDSADDSWEKKVKMFYKTCVDNYARDQNGAKHLIRLVNETLGGWQLINNSFSFDIKQSVLNMVNTLGVQVFFNFYPSRTNADGLRIILRTPTQVLYRTYFTESNKYYEQYTKAYRAYTFKVGQLLATDAGKDQSSDDIKDKIQLFSDDVVNFDKTIAQLASKASYSYVPIKTLQKSGAKLPVSDMLVNRYKDAGLTDKTSAYASTGFIQGLEGAITALGSNMNRVINNYMVFYFAHTYAGYLSFNYDLAYYTYQQGINRAASRGSTEETCLNLVKRRMPDAISAEYVFHHLEDNHKDDVEKILKLLKSTLQSRINTWGWMDKSTTDYAVKRVNVLSEQVGYPAYMADYDELNVIYINAAIKGKYTYFENLMNTTKLEIQADVNRAKGIFGSSDWFYPPISVRPYLHATRNALVVPAASMKFPYYWENAPTVHKFGGIGSVISEQLCRMVNNYGKKFWVNGTMSSGDNGLGWWSKQTYDGYTKNRQCLSDYFDKQKAGPFIVDGKNMGKFDVKGTMYADYAMYKIAAVLNGYLAYKDWIGQYGEDDLLPVMNVTNDQAYFIAAVQSGCATYKPSYALRLAQTSRPLLDIWYNGALAQTKEFSEVFKCSAKSKMNAEKKCIVF